MRVRRKKRTKRLIVLLSLLLLGIVGFRNILPNLGDVFQYHHVASGEYGWNLILVNRDNYIPDDYTVELTELSNGQKVDSRIYPSLQEMFDAARAEGLGLFVADGYRTAETQQQILEGKIEAYKNEGYSSEEAEKKAKEWVAVPGTSEHQLGLAVDINADKSKVPVKKFMSGSPKMRISMDLYNDTRRIKRILPIQFTNLGIIGMSEMMLHLKSFLKIFV